MAINFNIEPELKAPVMFCGWPGIGNIGIIAIDTLRGVLRAKEFAGIESWEFFNPRRVIIENGLLQDLEFPLNRFYYRHLGGQDVIFFIGQEQASGHRAAYAEGEKAYRLGNLVLDVAEKFGCRRIFTSGAAVAQIHHTVKPRVWAVPNNAKLIDEIKNYPNTILMSDLENRGVAGSITGLNGLMLGIAQKRGLDAICLMGEVPYYLQGAPWPYPKASQSVLEVITRYLEIQIEFKKLDELTQKIEQNVEDFVQKLFDTPGLPEQIKDEITRLEEEPNADLGPITDDEQKRMMGRLDELFNQRDDNNDRPV